MSVKNLENKKVITYFMNRIIKDINEPSKNLRTKTYFDYSMDGSYLLSDSYIIVKLKENVFAKDKMIQQRLEHFIDDLDLTIYKDVKRIEIDHDNNLVRLKSDDIIVSISKKYYQLFDSKKYIYLVAGENKPVLIEDYKSEIVGFILPIVEY